MSTAEIPLKFGIKLVGSLSRQVVIASAAPVRRLRRKRR